jgi:hypothetical protein
MTAFEIPTQPTPQRFTITLGGVDYRVTQKWNKVISCWAIDIADSGDVPILSGVPLVTGADLLEQFTYLGIGGQLVAQTDHDADAVPTFDNLGSTGHLYFVLP